MTVKDKMSNSVVSFKKGQNVREERIFDAVAIYGFLE